MTTQRIDRWEMRHRASRDMALDGTGMLSGGNWEIVERWQKEFRQEFCSLCIRFNSKLDDFRQKRKDGDCAFHENGMAGCCWNFIDRNADQRYKAWAKKGSALSYFVPPPGATDFGTLRRFIDIILPAFGFTGRQHSHGMELFMNDILRGIEAGITSRSDIEARVNTLHNDFLVRLFRRRQEGHKTTWYVACWLVHCAFANAGAAKM